MSDEGKRQLWQVITILVGMIQAFAIWMMVSLYSSVENLKTDQTLPKVEARIISIKEATDNNRATTEEMIKTLSAVQATQREIKASLNELQRSQELYGEDQREFYEKYGAALEYAKQKAASSYESR